MKKLINGYTNYWIYDNGDVYNEATQKILNGSIGENGYKYYRLSKDNVKKMFYAHRLVAEHFLANPNNLPVVNHKDGNKLNNNIDNLEWVTYSENAEHWHRSSNKTISQREYYKEDLPGEVWLPFKNYQVSSLGRIRHAQKNNLLKPSIAGGYSKVRLSENGITQDFLLHKLVYSLFNNDWDIDTSTYVIDHIDGNKTNNAVSNLRKITLSENVKAALYEQKTNPSAKIVQQFDLNGNYIATYPSAREASRALNLDASTISKVCRGKNKSHGNFIFKYL